MRDGLTQDDTHIIASIYPTMDACQSDLALLSGGGEANLEQDFALRQLWVCMPASSQFCKAMAQQ
jgi:hypothetical protein